MTHEEQAKRPGWIRQALCQVRRNDFVAAVKRICTEAVIDGANWHPRPMLEFVGESMTWSHGDLGGAYRCTGYGSFDFSVEPQLDVLSPAQIGQKVTRRVERVATQQDLRHRAFP